MVRRSTLAGEKSERVAARITPDQKMLFQRAAALHGRSLTDFLVASAQEAAEKTIRSHEVITLSARDSKAFVEALLNPSKEPNAALRQAFRRYDVDVDAS